MTAGYLDQHAVLEKGQIVRDVLRTAFDELSRIKPHQRHLYEHG